MEYLVPQTGPSCCPLHNLSVTSSPTAERWQSG